VTNLEVSKLPRWGEKAFPYPLDARPHLHFHRGKEPFYVFRAAFYYHEDLTIWEVPDIAGDLKPGRDPPRGIAKTDPLHQPEV